MSAVYPGLESPEFAKAFDRAVRDIAQLASFFDENDVGKQEPAPLDDGTVRTFEEVIRRYNALLDELRTLGAYIQGFVTTDSRNDTAQARLSELQQHSVLMSQLSVRLTAWIGSLDVEELIRRSEVAREHEFALREARTESEHLMSPAEEALAAELNVVAGVAWSKLHSSATSQLTVPVTLDGETRVLPMSEVRNLAYDPDRGVRRTAYEAELGAWKQAALPLAAALNSIKGQSNTLDRRQGWGSPLDKALFNNRIDRETLDAMLAAARESFPDFRRYLRAKARALGLDVLAWYDLFAPVGGSARTWEFPEAAAYIQEQFGTYSPKLRELARRAFEERWIDAEPREGKVDGAFCMSLRGDESRVLTNYKRAFGGVSTLAHELGHAYHNLNKAGRTMLQQATPMTLAETASIFCETIVFQAALRDADEQEQIAILEESLQGSCQVVVDITSRFLFEQAVLEGRLKHELSVDELNALMVRAQKDTYGDGLDPDALHPYMWAVKSHYYSAARPFYNFPYMFGLLFGLGLYAKYREDPDSFRAGYDDLLSSTGLADAASLAERFGINIRTESFWRSSLDVIRGDVDRYEALIERANQ